MAHAISIQRLNDPVSCGPALTWGGAAVAGTLTAAGDSACHRFTAAAGDRIRVNPQSATAGVNPATEVVRPDGTSLCGINSGPLTCTAGVGGTYTLLVRDPLPGGYGVSIQRLSNPVGCTWIGAYNAPVEPDSVARYVGAYIQDGWRLSRKLTLNLGLRLSVDSGAIPAQCRDAAKVPGDVANPAQCFDELEYPSWTSLAPLLLTSLLLLGDTADDPLGIRLAGPVAGLVVLAGWAIFRRYELPDEVALR